MPVPSRMPAIQPTSGAGPRSNRAPDSTPSFRPAASQPDVETRLCRRSRAGPSCSNAESALHWTTMTWRHVAAVLAVLIVVGPISTRASQRPASNRQDSLEELSRAERKWRASKVEMYEFRFQFTCGMVPPPSPDLPPILFRVEAGKNALLRPGPVPIPSELAQYSTVEKLFAFIRKAWTNRPFRVDVQYDQLRGYPIHVCVYPKANWNDIDFGFATSAFRDLAEMRVSRDRGGASDNRDATAVNPTGFVELSRR